MLALAAFIAAVLDAWCCLCATAVKESSGGAP